MPIRLVAIAALFCALLVAAVACGDDDGGGSTPTPTAAGSETSEPSATEPGETPTDGDEKTPGNDETPDKETPGTAGTPATPGTGGTPAIAPADQTAFIAQFAGATIEHIDCPYDPGTLIAHCGADGEYAVDPPLGGQDVTCLLGLVEDEPVYVNCMSHVPLQSIFYEIQ